MSDLESDILLFVATTTEYDVLEQTARAMGLTWDSGKSSLGKFRRLGRLGGHRVVAVKTDIGAIGARGSIRTANHYLQATGAHSFLCLGMAFGISRREQKHGTVLVGESLFPYDRRTVVADEDTGWRYEYPGARPYRASSFLPEILQRHHGTASLDHAVQYGCLLSGSARIQCARYRDALVAQTLLVAPGIIGGEMEGVGFLSIEQDDRRWIVVKGISDFADEERASDADANRRQACRNATRFALEALRGPLGSVV